jgi:protein SCO1/2
MKAPLFAAISAALFAVPAVHARAPLSPDSLYHLDAQLTDQSGAVHALDDYRGRPVLITMFYGSCPMACPLLIDTLRAVERATPPRERENLRILMVTIDPARDTPAALLALAKQRRIDTTRWTLARTDEKNVRKIAATLNIQYRALPDGGYNHSSVVTLLDPAGDIVMQSSVLGRADDALVDAIRATSTIVGRPVSH